MPRRSKVARLPEDVLSELHLRVIHSRFSQYERHSKWLKEQGHNISSVAVWRYFRDVQEESRNMLMAVSASTVTARLVASLAREAGEDYSLATEHLTQANTFRNFVECLQRDEISFESLEAFTALSNRQRLTRMRASSERKRTAETGLVARVDAFAPAVRETRAQRGGAKTGDPMAVIRKIRALYGIADD